MLLCLSVHTTLICPGCPLPPSTSNVLLILPNLAHLSHALWNLWSLSCLLGPRIPWAVLSVSSVGYTGFPDHPELSYLQSALPLPALFGAIKTVTAVSPLHVQPPAHSIETTEAVSTSALRRGSWASHWDVDVPLFLEQFQMITLAFKNPPILNIPAFLHIFHFEAA